MVDALLSIGGFARAAGLSPKALRLYDELGLLPPVTVDANSGYRFYDPAQLDRARLIAWLWRLGMPLMRIGQVCDLDAPAVAEQVARFWEQTQADTAAKGGWPPSSSTTCGLSAVVAEEVVRQVLTGPGDPPQVLEELMGLAYAAGAPDNVACVVADVVSLTDPATAGVP